MPELDEVDPETYDAYIQAHVQLPVGDQLSLGTVFRRKRDKDGNPVGRHNNNPILDTRVYEVEFSDGQVLEYAANLIAENMYSEVDDEGHHQVMFDEITNHKSDKSAVLPDDGWTILNGNKHRRIIPKGWKLCGCRNEGGVPDTDS
jgi:hypothetical protein